MIREGSFDSSSETAGDSIFGLLEVTNAFRGSRSFVSWNSVDNEELFDDVLLSSPGRKRAGCYKYVFGLASRF